MLLIGSRAIRFYFPDFREPRDWDLVGTQTEIDELAKRLPLAGPQRPDKAHFTYGGRLVEVGNASVLPYWAKIVERFADGPRLVDDELGSLIVAPPEYLLLTKHCGLVYRVVHWHKNLEDLYFLRDRIATIPDEVADLVADTVSDSARMFGASHERATITCLTCCAKTDQQSPQWHELHAELHHRVRLSTTAARDEVDAWRGFPHVSASQRTLLMQRLLAEEAMVVAAQAMVLSPAPGPAKPPDEWLRWALRSLCIGELPVGMRYFAVNYYRELRSLVRPDWYEFVADLTSSRAAAFQECVTDERFCTQLANGVSAEERETAPAGVQHKARGARIPDPFVKAV